MDPDTGWKARLLLKSILGAAAGIGLLVLIQVHLVLKDFTPLMLWLPATISVALGSLFAMVLIGKRRQELALSDTRSTLRRLEDIANISADWIWEVDAEGRFTYVSKRIEEILGFTCEEVLGKSAFDFMPEDEARRVRKIFSRLVAEKASMRALENWHLSRHGSRICLLSNGMPILDDQGRLLGYRGADRDITLLKRQEELEHLLAEIELQPDSCDRRELLERLLRACRKLCDSPFGFLLESDPSSGRFSCRSWSGRREIAPGWITQELEDPSFWADCERSRKPLQRETPHAEAGHLGPLLTRVLMIPILEKGRVTAILGVSGKARPYTEVNRDLLQEAAEKIWHLLARKDNSLTQKETEERQAALYHLLIDLNRCQTLSEAAPYLCNAGTRVTGLRQSGLLLLDRDEAHLVYDRDLPAPLADLLQDMPRANPALQRAEQGADVIDLLQHSDELRNRSGACLVRRVFLAPIGTGSEIVGYLVLASQESGELDSVQLNWLSLLTANTESALERIQQQQQLMLQSALLDHVDEAVLALDRKGQVILWNEAASRIYGLEGQQAIGRKVRDLLPSPMDPTQIDEIRETINRKGEWTRRVKQHRVNGEAFDSDWRVTQVRGANGMLLAYASIVRELKTKRLPGGKTRRS